MRSFLVLLSLITSLAACGLPGTYCQSGPKHGTQCYSQSDIQGGAPGKPERERP